jgi:hypothetical protein
MTVLVVLTHAQPPGLQTVWLSLASPGPQSTTTLCPMRTSHQLWSIPPTFHPPPRTERRFKLRLCRPRPGPGPPLRVLSRPSPSRHLPWPSSPSAHLLRHNNTTARISIPGFLNLFPQLELQVNPSSRQRNINTPRCFDQASTHSLRLIHHPSTPAAAALALALLASPHLTSPHLLIRLMPFPGA